MKRVICLLTILLVLSPFLVNVRAQKGVFNNAEWKVIQEDGYMLKLPKNFTDGGTTASGIHYFNGINVSIETDCLTGNIKVEDELAHIYAASSKDFQQTYDLVYDEHTNDHYLVIISDKEGNTYYEKSITSDHCIYTLKFDIGKKRAKLLSENDANIILGSFVAAKISRRYGSN